MERSSSDRRLNRTQNTKKALEYWLESCSKGSVVDEMVLFDLDGLCLASSGELGPEVAASCSTLARRVPFYQGQIPVGGKPRNLRFKRFRYQGECLVVCGLGGLPSEARARRIERSAQGVARILH